MEVLIYGEPGATSAPGARQPRQARSQRTLDALLDATEALLETRPFHDVAVTAIVARAGSSAGSFYTRFPDKTALLHALHERVAARAVAMADWLRTAAARTGPAGNAAPAHGDARQTARQVARLVVGNLVRGHHRHRGVLRAVAIESFRDPRFTARALHVAAAMRDAGVVALRPHLAAVHAAGHAPADRDVDFALRMVLATLDQQLFIPPAAQAVLAQDDDTLGARLADAFIRQLHLA